MRENKYKPYDQTRKNFNYQSAGIIHLLVFWIGITTTLLLPQSAIATETPNSSAPITEEFFQQTMKKYCIPMTETNCNPNTIAKYDKKTNKCVCSTPGAIWNTVTRECYLCTPGEYLKNQTDRQCSKCPAGYKCAGGATSPVKCPAGTYNTNTGNSTCTDCPTGHYCTGGNNLTNCPVGTYNPNTKQSALSSCISCPAGTYNPSIGQTSSSACRACPAGQYQPNTRQSSCRACGNVTITKYKSVQECHRERDGSDCDEHGGHCRGSWSTECKTKTVSEKSSLRPGNYKARDWGTLVLQCLEQRCGSRFSGEDREHYCYCIKHNPYYTLSTSLGTRNIYGGYDSTFTVSCNKTNGSLSIN